jgi:4-diphosphocytidyl-2-C-methyl-D-erythritol kinase
VVLLSLFGKSGSGSAVNTLRQFCPAKINPFLAVTGRRTDGFHELVSLALPVSVGDELTLTRREEPGFTLECDDPTLPTDASNLVLQAADRFVAATNWTGGAHFALRKRLPAGAGLGGGSSDAVGALRALNQLAGGPLNGSQLATVAAEVGSDCPLFLANAPVIMRGRGELISPLPESARERSQDMELVLCKPPFGVNTGWAYGQLAALAPESYLPVAEAEARLQAWLESPQKGMDDLGFNSFTSLVEDKYPALSALRLLLRDKLGAQLHLSGSGSACFVWVESGEEAAQVERLVTTTWDPHAWVCRTRSASVSAIKAD